MDNNCNCKKTTVEHSICNQCAPTPCDGCEVKDLSTDCVLYDGDRLECSNIETNQPLTEVIIALDQYICTAIAQFNDSINLVNVGIGAQIYAGIDNLGKRKIKTLTSTNNSVNIVSEDDTINLSVLVPDGSETKINAGSNVTITGIGTTDTPYVITTATTSIPNLVQVTDLNSNVITKPITATGFSAYSLFDGVNSFPRSSYGFNGVTIYNSSLQRVELIGTTLKWHNAQSGGATNILNLDRLTSGIATYSFPAKVAGSYILATISDIVIPDGSETKINVGSGLTVSGLGTISSPYIINKVNLQKTVITSTNYLLLNADLDHLIFIDNGASNITINVPNTLSDNFEAGFLRLGTGEVSFTPTGGSILRSPGGKFRIAEQNGNAFIVKQSNSLNISVNGSLKV